MNNPPGTKKFTMQEIKQAGKNIERSSNCGFEEYYKFILKEYFGIEL